MADETSPATNTTKDSRKSGAIVPMDGKPVSTASITFGPLGVARLLIYLFSNPTAQRDPPATAYVKNVRHVRLITISGSHFCEKVRWAFDLLEEKQQQQEKAQTSGKDDTRCYYHYTEDAHAPPFHAFQSLPASKGEASVTPMIVWNDCGDEDDDNGHKTVEHVSFKSDVIMQKFCPSLYPQAIADKISEKEHELGVRLGASVRCFMYHYLLQPAYYPSVITMITQNCCSIESTMFKAMLEKGIAVGMRKSMKITPENAAFAEQEIRKVFKEVSDRLDEIRASRSKEDKDMVYLLDTPEESFGFTAADVAFASLAYPLIMPPQMASFLSMEETSWPPEIIQLKRELQETTAGKHCLALYEKHRPVSIADGLVHIKAATPAAAPARNGWFSFFK